MSAEFGDALRALVEKSIARNHQGRSDFASKSRRLQQILLNGEYSDLDGFIEQLDEFSDGRSEASDSPDGPSETGSH